MPLLTLDPTPTPTPPALPTITTRAVPPPNLDTLFTFGGLPLLMLLLVLAIATVLK